MPLNGSPAPERIIEGTQDLVAASWSRDGKWLAQLNTVGNVQQIFVRPVRDSKLDSGEPRQLSPSTFWQAGPVFSPDGRWIAYSSIESGTWEVYVQSFPSPGEKHRISYKGGSNAAWSRNGRELFYLATRSQTASEVSMMAVDFSTTSDFKASDPRLLFEGPYVSSAPLRSYDVTPDGQFIMTRWQSPPDQPVTRLNVVLGWAEELKRRVPTK